MKQPIELRQQKIAFFDLINEYTKVRKYRSEKSLSLLDLNVLKEWAREYNIFIRSHLGGHGDKGGNNYVPSHIHVDITGRGMHGRIHYLVDTTS